MKTQIKCIANSDTDAGPEVCLWECPCLECTKLEWEASEWWNTQDGENHPVASLKAHRIENWPEHYTA